jgi:hypothetical protein
MSITHSTTMPNFLKNPIFWAKFLGYALPLAFLAYVLYQNYLPFGYDKTFTITVGGPTDTSIGEFYLEPSTNLSERKTDESGTPYRTLNGLATAVFKPSAILKNATISVETSDPGVYLIPPTIDFNPASTTWDVSYDFTKNIPTELKNSKAFVFDGATYFDGSARVELPQSSKLFEKGAFTLYAEWMPTDEQNDAQQIVGHYNWELWQNKNSVSFQVGRMNDAKGPAYKIHSLVGPDFWGKKHSALAVYNPGENGYLELYVDGKFADRTYFGTSTIWGDYNGDNNLTFGWTPHNYKKSAHFKGSLYNFYFSKNNILPTTSRFQFLKTEDVETNITLFTTTNTPFKKLNLHASQK